MNFQFLQDVVGSMFENIVDHEFTAFKNESHVFGGSFPEIKTRYGPGACLNGYEFDELSTLIYI